MLSGERTKRRAQGHSGKGKSPYHATVQTYPLWRIGGRRRSSECRPAQEAQSPMRASAAHTSATRPSTARASAARASAARASAQHAAVYRGHKARSLNLFALWQGWWSEVWTANRRTGPRRSQVRLGKPKRERPSWYAAVWSLVQTAWQVGGYTAINILFLALVGWALFWFFSDEQFYISTIQVIGNQRVSAEAIVAASGLQNYSVFWVNPQQVARQIGVALPPVRRVRVQYGLSNRVTLLVEEQGGQVMWQVAGMNYWVDDDGQLHPVQGEATPSLIVQDIRPGAPERVDPQAVQAAQQLLELLPEVKTLGYAPTTGLRFRHPRGWEVYLGTDEMARKVNILRAIEQQFAGEDTPQPSLVDLRFPDSPYYRLPDSPVSGSADGNGA